MTDLIAALGLAMVIEGAIYALFPDGMKSMLVQVLNQPAGVLRGFGLVLAVVGVGVVWLVRG
ncbi:MAG: DUF2065 domain-containing protein [Hyphomicrobiales bacterium]|nr:DUF2065 domain-containing protein [Hyphomicrobiales bacterium]MCP5373769.1 DUF2065 domain-containing protein [Hyphomicrobiales bacterium]